jgi:hypothetical protein
MTNSESRPAPSPEAASDDYASPSHARPGEPADRLAFEAVPLRYREDGFTPEKQRAYVEALADCGIAREAAARVGLSEQAINRVRRRSDARSFDDACEAAHLFGARRLHSIAYERAVEGTVRGHYYHGERVGEERVYDNRLLTYLLGKTGHLLERDERKSRAICENWEAHMEALEQGLPTPGREAKAMSAQCAAEEEFTGLEIWESEGTWWTGFPPPADFDGFEEGRYGDPGYRRSLSDWEQGLIDADEEEELAEACARRDRFFGLPGDEVSSSKEAETHETSEPTDPDPGPIEYKSLVAPAPARPPSFRRKPESVNATVRSPRPAGSWMAHRARDIEAPSPPRFGKRRAIRPPHIQTAPPRHPYR